jgi:DNA sulfur modification protein DndD
MLRFTSLTVENFGPFKGSQTIDFTKGDGVTIIWGDNGRGKTTLLNVFRYALYGKFQNRRGAEVDLTALSNIESRSDGEYGFKVNLCMENDGKEYKLTRQYRVRHGITKPTKNDDYEHLVFLSEDGAMLSGEAIDHLLKIIMPEEVARFFLFDGELLEEYEELIRDGSDDGAKIKDSIERILGVPVLANSATDAESVLDEYGKAKTRIAQSNQQTQKIGSEIAALDAKIQEHTTELNRLRNELAQERAKETSLQNDLNRTIISEICLVT